MLKNANTADFSSYTCRRLTDRYLLKKTLNGTSNLKQGKSFALKEENLNIPMMNAETL
jgi:hypothetical protein